MNHNNENQDHKEIDIKEIVLLLWKNKKFIIKITLLFGIIIFLFSKFIIEPRYDTRLNIVINMPEKYNTRYGEYTLPITSNDQYINLIKSNSVLLNTIRDMNYDENEVILENIQKSITISDIDTKSNKINNSFLVTVSANYPQKSLQLAEILFDNYIEFMDVMIKERALDYYYDYFNVEIKALENSLDSHKEILLKNQELLNSTPQFIDTSSTNLEFNTNINNTSSYVIPLGTVNPNYIKIENDIISNKQDINIIENSIRMNKQYLTEIEKEMQLINKYFENGQVTKLETSVIGIVENSIYLPSPPVAPTLKSSPNNVLNATVGSIVGGIISVMIVLIRVYWFQNEN